MRPDKLYLTDIQGAAEAVQRFVAETDRARFVKDELRQSAVLQKLIVIGEAAARLSAEFRGEHPDIEWSDVIAFRNIAVHEYFAVQWDVVWVTAAEEVPVLRRQVGKILADEYSDD